MGFSKRDVLLGLLGLASFSRSAVAMDAAERWVRLAGDADGIIVPVRVNSIETLATVDNGSNVTLISSEMAPKLKVWLSGEKSVVGSWGSQRQADLTETSYITVADLTVGVKPEVLSFGDAGPPQPVLLGMDVFRRSLIDLDFPRNRMRLRHRVDLSQLSKAVLISSQEAEVSVPLKRPPTNIPLILEGGLAKASLDLGSDVPLHISRPLAERYHLLSGRPVSSSLSGSVGGFSTAPLSSCRSVVFANHKFLDVPFEVFDSREEMAVVGLPLARRFHILLDGWTQTLAIMPSDVFLDQPFSKDRSGLSTVRVGPALKVLFVAPGSPGALSGLQSGDKIASIDGIPALSVTGHSWKRGAVGSRIALRLTNGSDHVLLLRDYY